MMNSTEIQKLMKSYVTKLNNLEEMDKFLDHTTFLD